MYYFIGDIHGELDKLRNLFKRLINQIDDKQDTIIFLGDYIDRGDKSYGVVEYILDLSGRYNVIFLKGNHEDMLLNYLDGNDKHDMYLYNGGDATIRSYKENYNNKFYIPEHHMNFYKSLSLYYEGKDFIAVHAGLNPEIDNIHDQDMHDIIWIREEFFSSSKRWEKTVIFGHTPTSFFSKDNLVYIDKERNIIGIDSGVIFGSPLTCLTWPDRKVYNSEYHT